MFRSRSLFLYCFLFSFQLLLGQQRITEPEKNSFLPDIRSGKYDGEYVEFEGTVTHWEQIPQSTTIQYWIEDRWGEIIPVRSINTHPEYKMKYRISGTVNLLPQNISLNKINSMRFIEEHNRQELTIVDVNPVNQLQRQAQQLLQEAENIVAEVSGKWYYDNENGEKALRSAQSYYTSGDYQLSIDKANLAISESEHPDIATVVYLIIAAVIIFLVLVFMNGYKDILSVKRKKPYVMEKTDPEKKSETIKATPIQTEGNDKITVVIPPQGTVKLLSGKFKVLNGDKDIKEIRLFLSKQNPNGEYSFGRLPGNNYTHVQLNHETVSSDQAKLLVSSSQYTLINRADGRTKNATKINGRDLEINESVALHQGDIVSMGIFEMSFCQN